MDDPELLAITLYVPDATVRVLGGDAWVARWLRDGAVGLSFLALGWWEGSHTARLAPWRGVDSGGAQENAAEFGGEGWLG
jgi:hypothetical protein